MEKLKKPDVIIISSESMKFRNNIFSKVMEHIKGEHESQQVKIGYLSLGSEYVSKSNLNLNLEDVLIAKYFTSIDQLDKNALSKFYDLNLDYIFLVCSTQANYENIYRLLINDVQIKYHIHAINEAKMRKNDYILTSKEKDFISFANLIVNLYQVDEDVAHSQSDFTKILKSVSKNLVSQNLYNVDGSWDDITSFSKRDKNKTHTHHSDTEDIPEDASAYMSKNEAVLDTIVKKIVEPRPPLLKRLTRPALFIAGILVIAYMIKTFVFGGVESKAFETIDYFTKYFIVILVQLIPFVLLAGVISGILKFFVKEKTFINWINRDGPLSFVAIIVLSICLPICDCGFIPFVSNLVKSGVKIEKGLCFFAMSLAFNPLILLSTYYAYPDKQLQIMLIRMGVSFVLAILIYIVVKFFGKFAGPKSQEAGQFYNCACCVVDDTTKSKSFSSRATELFQHTITEFFTMFRYIIVGVLVLSFIQTFISKRAFVLLGNSGISRFFVFLFICIFMSACANSNAFIGRSFMNILPFPIIMLYMGFSPLLDFKNVMLLKYGFGFKFTAFYALALVGLALIFYPVFLHFFPLLFPSIMAAV